MFGKQEKQVNFGYVEVDGFLHPYRHSAPENLANMTDGRIVMVGTLGYQKKHWFSGYSVYNSRVEMKSGTKWNEHVLVARTCEVFSPKKG